MSAWTKGSGRKDGGKKTDLRDMKETELMRLGKCMVTLGHS